MDYIAAVFDDMTGKIRLPDKTIWGDYCIEGTTLYLEHKGWPSETVVIEILSIESETMVLKMTDGKQFKFYNPYPDLSNENRFEI